MSAPLNPRLSGLKFSTICGTAYTAEQLRNAAPSEGYVQLSEDQGLSLIHI